MNAPFLVPTNNRVLLIVSVSLYFFLSSVVVGLLSSFYTTSVRLVQMGGIAAATEGKDGWSDSPWDESYGACKKPGQDSSMERVGTMEGKAW